MQPPADQTSPRNPVAAISCAAFSPARTIVLVGMMGAGKTSVGARLARRLGIPFVDADTEIEKAANRSVAEIFDYEGEAVFRAGERRVIARLLDGPVHVLATGGGAFMDPETRKRIRERAVAIWLKADIETLLRRTGRRKTRPLLNQGDPRGVLERLMETRHPIYAEAELQVDSLPGSADDTVEAVIATLMAHAAEERRQALGPAALGPAAGGLEASAL